MPSASASHNYLCLWQMKHSKEEDRERAAFASNSHAFNLPNVTQHLPIQEPILLGIHWKNWQLDNERREGFVKSKERTVYQNMQQHITLIQCKYDCIIKSFLLKLTSEEVSSDPKKLTPYHKFCSALRCYWTRALYYCHRQTNTTTQFNLYNIYNRYLSPRFFPKWTIKNYEASYTRSILKKGGRVIFRDCNAERPYF